MFMANADSFDGPVQETVVYTKTRRKVRHIREPPCLGSGVIPAWAPSDELEIPPSYVVMITDAFGPTCDLYDDVLCVPQNATEKMIRIAYFRRGREVLGDAYGQNASPRAKLEFQALSMAYEILTTPTWKESYDLYGLYGKVGEEAEEDDEEREDEDEYSNDHFGGGDVMSDDSTVETRSVMRPPRRARGESAMPSEDDELRKSRSVRWKEEVEELVFDQDPSERLTRKEKRKRRKKKVVVDAQELEKHLAQLDQQAEGHFANDFFDDLEASIDGLLSLGSGSKQVSKYVSTKTKTQNLAPLASKMQATPNSAFTRYRSPSPPPPLGALSPASSSPSTPRAGTPPPPNALIRVTTTEPSQPRSFQKASTKDGIKKRRFSFKKAIQNIVSRKKEEKPLPLPLPENKKESNERFVVVKKNVQDDATCSSDGSISTLSVSVVSRGYAPLRCGSAGKCLARVEEEGEGDGCQFLPYNGKRTVPSSSSVATPDNLGPDCCEHWLERRSEDEDDLDDAAVSREETDPFLQYFFAFMKALSDDISAFGNSLTSNAFFNSVAISDDEMEGMLGILQRELEITADKTSPRISQ